MKQSNEYPKTMQPESRFVSLEKAAPLVCYNAFR